jgi:hypothetical protein
MAMNLTGRIKRLEAKMRPTASDELTLAICRRIMDGDLTEGEWRHYGPILESLLAPVDQGIGTECRGIG